MAQNYIKKFFCQKQAGLLGMETLQFQGDIALHCWRNKLVPRYLTALRLVTGQ